MAEPFATVEDVVKALESQQYITDRDVALGVYLASTLRKPLLVEGEPGCGKTEIAKAIAGALRTELIRLQCYEGLDANAALYEWDYPKQLLTIRIQERAKDPEALEREVFNERFLLERPLLRALRSEGPVPRVLLIDEIDRADEEFEGFLLEILSDFQISIPEIGTIKAETIPFVLITSNRTRELSDALKRRCLYLYIGYPSPEKEVAILRRKVPALGQRLAEEIAAFVQRVRAEPDLAKRPGVSESLDWAMALLKLGYAAVDREAVERTRGILIKDAQDLLSLQSDRLDALMGRG